MSSAVQNSSVTAADAVAATHGFVLHHHYQRRSRKRKGCGDCRKELCCRDKRYSSFLSSTLTSFNFLALILAIVMGLLCSCVASDAANSSLMLNTQTNSKNDYPKFDITDLANLMDMFPEFRQYVLNVITQYEKQQNTNYLSSSATTSTTPRTFTTTTAYYLLPPSSNNVKADWGNWNFGQNGKKDPDKRDNIKVANAKHDGYYNNYYDDYHPQPTYSKYSSSKGYGYGYDYGWPSTKPDSHHHYHYHHDHEPEKDAEYHYEVGYGLGKDLSCVLSLLGFKSWKDFSFHNIIKFFKKLKYIVLIGLAFKLGVILSPFALPLIVPTIVLGAAIKFIPLLLITFLLIKLVKAQLKLGFLGREMKWERDDLTRPFLFEGTQVSSLWRSIDDITETVSKNESCIKKIICLVEGSRQSKHLNMTSRSLKSGFKGNTTTMNNSFLQRSKLYFIRILDWVLAFNETRSTAPALTKVSNATLNCEDIPCSWI